MKDIDIGINLLIYILARSHNIEIWLLTKWRSEKHQEEKKQVFKLMNVTADSVRQRNKYWLDSFQGNCREDNNPKRNQK